MHQVNIDFYDDDEFNYDDLESETSLKSNSFAIAGTAGSYALEQNQKVNKKVELPAKSTVRSDNLDGSGSALRDGELNIIMPDRYIITGQSESGKSTCIRWLIMQLCTKFPVANIWWFGKNAHEEIWLPEKYRLPRISKTRIDNIRKLQKKFALRYHQIIVLDDIIGEDFHGKDKIWYSDFIATSRHELITVICGIQYLKALNPCFRDNIQKYIVCDANNTTLDLLYTFCTNKNMNKRQWFQSFNFIKGKPVCISTVSGTKNLTRITVPNITAKDIKY